MKKDFPFKLKDSSFKMEKVFPLAFPLVYTIQKMWILFPEAARQ